MDRREIGKIMNFIWLLNGQVAGFCEYGNERLAP
jgi:hypothetical protein